MKFSTQIILSAAYALMSNVTSLYIILSEILFEDNGVIYFTVPNILWVATNFGVLSIMVYSAVEIHNEV